MQTFLFIVSWLLFGLATAYFAKQRGRDPTIWFLIGTFFGILGLLLVFILPAVKSDGESTVESAEVFEGEPQPQLPHHDYAIKDWYYYDDKKERVGPISFEELRTRWFNGSIRSDTYLWSEGMVNWEILRDVPDLESHIQN